MSGAVVAMNEQPDYGMPVHPVCDLFPLMAEDAMTKLTADIRANGLIDPIVRHQGQVVDGRNRLLACRAAGVELRFVEWSALYPGPMPLVRWIWSVNVERRHLTLDQITAAEVALRGWEEQQAAKERQIEAGKQQAEHGKEGGRGNKKPVSIDRCKGVSATDGQPSVKPERAGVAAKLAREIGVSERRVQRAINVNKENPELLKEVVQGKRSLCEAERRVKGNPAAEQRKVRSQRIDSLARSRVALLEQTKHFTQLIGWLGETHGDFDQAEALLRKASESTAALSTEIERIAVAADPLNASRLGIQEKTA